MSLHKVRNNRVITGILVFSMILGVTPVNFADVSFSNDKLASASNFGQGSNEQGLIENLKLTNSVIKNMYTDVNFPRVTSESFAQLVNILTIISSELNSGNIKDTRILADTVLETNEVLRSIDLSRVGLNIDNLEKVMENKSVIIELQSSILTEIIHLETVKEEELEKEKERARKARIEAGMKAFKNFKLTKKSPTFKDITNIPESKAIKNVYMLGLMNGKDAKSFNPTGKATIADIISYASKIHSTFTTGKTTIPASGSAWYSGAVQYAENIGIISKGEFTNMNKYATKAEAAEILANALPSDFMEGIKNNKVYSIPDVYMLTPNYTSITKLYQAGITKGVTTRGDFQPFENITRAELASWLNNIVTPTDRKAFTQSGVTQKQGSYAFANTNRSTYTYNGAKVKRKTDITPRFGTHTYNTETQKEYDALMAIMDKAWVQYQNALAKDGYVPVNIGGGNYVNLREAHNIILNNAPNMRNGYELLPLAEKMGIDINSEAGGQWLDKLLIFFVLPPDNPAEYDEYNANRLGNIESEQKMIEWYEFSAVVGKILRETPDLGKTKSGGSETKNLYDVWISGGYSGDCDCDAQTYSIVADYLGINTRVVASGSHGYTEFELMGKNGKSYWIHNEGNIIYNNYNAKHRIDVQPTYKTTTALKNLSPQGFDAK